MYLRCIIEMGSYFSKNECNDENIQKQKNIKNHIVSYASKSTDYIDPISIILKYIGKENIIWKSRDEEYILLIEYEDGGVSFNGFLPIIKYIGRTNNLYPNRNYFDCALVDTWLDRFMNVKTLLYLYKENKISSEHYFNYLKNEFENFSTHNNFGDSFFIENFDSPTVSDFCWYSFFIYCIKDTSHSPIITSYNYILDYVNKMEDHIINIESEEEEKEEEEEEGEDEGEENRELKKDV